MKKLKEICKALTIAVLVVVAFTLLVLAIAADLGFRWGV